MPNTMLFNIVWTRGVRKWCSRVYTSNFRKLYCRFNIFCMYETSSHCFYFIFLLFQSRTFSTIQTHIHTNVWRYFTLSSFNTYHIQILLKRNLISCSKPDNGKYLVHCVYYCFHNVFTKIARERASMKSVAQFKKFVCTIVRNDTKLSPQESWLERVCVCLWAKEAIIFYICYLYL